MYRVSHSSGGSSPLVLSGGASSPDQVGLFLGFLPWSRNARVVRYWRRAVDDAQSVLPKTVAQEVRLRLRIEQRLAELDQAQESPWYVNPRKMDRMDNAISRLEDKLPHPNGVRFKTASGKVTQLGPYNPQDPGDGLGDLLELTQREFRALRASEAEASGYIFVGGLPR